MGLGRDLVCREINASLKKNKEDRVLLSGYKIEYVHKMAARGTAEMEGYKRKMRELSGNRAFGVPFGDIMRTPKEEIEQRLIESHLSTRGSTRAKAERLFRAYIQMIGLAEVLWFPEVDEEKGTVAAENEEMVMGPSDQKMVAAQNRGESDVRSADEEEASALRPSTTDTVTTAPSSWLQQREFPRSRTTATYM